MRGIEGQLSLFNLLQSEPELPERRTDKASRKVNILDVSKKYALKRRTFIHYKTDWSLRNGPYLVSATIALFEDCSVYVGDWMTYRCYIKFGNMKQAAQYYEEYLKKISERNVGIHSVQLEVGIHEDFKPMYHCKDNEYWEERYWKDNFSANRTLRY